MASNGGSEKVTVPVDFRKASRDSKSAQVHFIFTELYTGLTFALIAHQAKKREARLRNRSRARAAYDCIVRFVDRVSMTREESREVHTRMSSLRERLQDLGEKLPAPPQPT